MVDKADFFLFAITSSFDSISNIEYLGYLKLYTNFLRIRTTSILME